MMPRGLIVAFGFLTRLPMPEIQDFRDDDLKHAAHWFPAVGLIIGGLAAAPLAAGVWVGPEIAALISLLVWVAVTGALHIDGLADSADGLAAAHGRPDRFLEAARDSHVGTFGVVAIALVLLAKVVALMVIAKSVSHMAFLAVILVPAWARWSVLVLSRAVASLGQGRGAAFAEAADWPAIVGLGVALAIPTLVVAPALIVGPVLAWLAVRFWRVRLGGISGDGHGATIEVAEATLLVALAVETYYGFPVSGLLPEGWS